MAEPGDLRWNPDDRSPVRAVRLAVSGDPAGLPDRLCRALAAALEVDGAGMSILTDSSLRLRLGSSDELAELLETVQFTVGEGPCVQAAATGEPVIVEDLHAESGARWPGFADLAAQRLGAVGAVFGFPLGVDGVTVGSVNLYSRTRRALSRAQIAETSQAVAIATAALLASPHSTVEPNADEFVETLTSGEPWGAMHLAIGIMAGLLDIGTGEALARMRAHAFNHDMLLTDLATDILTGGLSPSELNR
jgi:hypothetical protein